MGVRQLTVFGAGLIGGSVCLGARQAGFADRIIAIDRTPQHDRIDVADMWVDAADAETVDDVLAHSDLTVLCTPVRSIIDWLPRVLTITPGWVTDCGSTKVATAATARLHHSYQRFIPGHPMAGHPIGGLAQASAGLFEQRRWILCPGDADPAGVQCVRELITALGAEVVLLEARAHDHSVAWTSHLPQVVASTLSVLSAEEEARAAAGPGFASATRVAGGEPTMWRDIFETNGDEIASALESMGNRLSELANALRAGDTEPAIRALQQARSLREES